MQHVLGSVGGPTGTFLNKQLAQKHHVVCRWLHESCVSANWLHVVSTFGADVNYQIETHHAVQCSMDFWVPKYWRMSGISFWHLVPFILCLTKPNCGYQSCPRWVPQVEQKGSWWICEAKTPLLGTSLQMWNLDFLLERTSCQVQKTILESWRIRSSRPHVLHHHRRRSHRLRRQRWQWCRWKLLRFLWHRQSATRWQKMMRAPTGSKPCQWWRAGKRCSWTSYTKVRGAEEVWRECVDQSCQCSQATAKDCGSPGLRSS